MINSSTKDINIYESGSGGDMSILNGDLRTTESLYQTIYLALFGGNVAASTLGNEVAGEERKDWWGNSLLFENSNEKQFNSLTEKALIDNAINSSGRLKIKSAVEADLTFLKKIASIEINVLILSVDKIEINISLSSLKNQADNSLRFIWDNAKREIITDTTI